VISVAVLRGAAAAGYYLTREGCEQELVQDLRRPTGSEQDGLAYYVNGRDAPGRWIGGGARALGLTGAVAVEHGQVLAELLGGGYRGERLVPPVWRRDETGARVDARRSGFDVTFSAPKSVSTLMALAAPDQATEIMAAHTAAATEALALLETLSARAARGHQGEEQRAPRIATSGFVAAGFTHTTSRAMDPQLHTHVVIANLAQGVDGRWSALDSRTLHREATTASYLYQHRLRAELTVRLGVAWTDVTRGVAEIDGVPREVRAEFSTRRRQIQKALAGRADDPQRGSGISSRARHLAARAACLATRPVKRHQGASELRRNWADRAQAAGFGPEAAAALLAGVHEAPVVDLPQIARQALQAEGVTREQSTFGRGAVVRELIARTPGGAQVGTDELLATAAALVTDDEVIPVLTPDGRAYTTRELLRSEAETLVLATRTDQRLAAQDKQTVAAAIARQGAALRLEQQRIAFALLTSGRPVEVLTGPAGCGKTAGLRIAVDTWRATGVPVAGCAVAALTAQGLEQASGAAAVSLARLLHQPDRHLPSRGVLLVDEAGMVGTRQLHRLLTAAADRQCKVVLVGDPEQLPELEAGGMFARLAQQSTTLTLEGHGRQREEWERDALQAFRTGDVAAGLDAYADHDRFHTCDDRDSLQAEAVAAYLHARAQQPDPWQAVLLASSREQVRDLNDEVRARLLVAGVLGRKALRIETDDGPVSFRVGDQVLVTRNDHRRGLLNGTTATVTALDDDGLRLKTSSGQQVTVDRSWLQDGRLDHGYAMTLHKAQGRTVHTSLVIGSESLSAQAGYVGLSRGTHANHLYLSARDVHGVAADCSSRVQHLRPGRTRTRNALSRDARQQLAGNWSRSNDQSEGRAR
jgi:conjugative relaxase-like TrwC/TraI family protein